MASKMTKNLMITEIKDPEGKVVKLSIRGQSHFEKEFGGGKNHFIYGLDPEDKVGKFVLASEVSPTFLDPKHTMEEYKCEFGLGVMGRDASKDHMVFDVPPDLPEGWFELMHRAVEEYNKFFNSCTSCRVRHCNTCGIIVENTKGTNVGQVSQDEQQTAPVTAGIG